jgi:hypothetical protein
LNGYKEIIRQEKLSPNDNLAKNYAIQQLYPRKTQVADKRTHSIKTINPYRYDFEDFRGDKDWTKCLSQNYCLRERPMPYSATSVLNISRAIKG